MGQPQPSGKRKSQVERAYDFFVQAERNRHRFTPSDIKVATGYRDSTIEIYITKKWWWFLQSDQGAYTVKGLLKYPLEQFINDHRQKKQVPISAQSGVSTPPLFSNSSNEENTAPLHADLQGVMLVAGALLMLLWWYLLRKRRSRRRDL